MPDLPNLASTVGLTSIPAGARCARHPEAPAVAACRRCGTFICANELVVLDASQFCRECAARPDVDYLEAFRLKYWGKRDSWAWFFGFTCIVNGLAAIGMLAVSVSDPAESGPVMVGAAAALLLWSIVAGGFFLGQRWSRPALVVVVLLYGVVQAVQLDAAALAVVILPLAIVASALGSVRTQLFFRMDVPRERLRRAWSLLHDNVPARRAMTLGLAGLAFAPFAPIALALGIVALRRVDPTAHPPVGRKGQAIAGIVLGALGTAVWSLLAAANVTKKL